MFLNAIIALEAAAADHWVACLVKLVVVQGAGLKVAQEVGLRVACWVTEVVVLVLVPVEALSECPESCCLRCRSTFVLEARSASEPGCEPAEAATTTTRPQRQLLPPQGRSSKPSLIQ